jgi:hypothetical protein
MGGSTYSLCYERFFGVEGGWGGGRGGGEVKAPLPMKKMKNKVFGKIMKNKVLLKPKNGLKKLVNCSTLIKFFPNYSFLLNDYNERKVMR